MKKLLILLVLIIAGFVAYKLFKKDKPPKVKPVAEYVSKYSTGFNTSIENALNAYYTMADGFVNWDSAVVASSSVALDSALVKISLDEIKKDSIIYQTAQFPLENSIAGAKAIAAGKTWEERRRSLKDLSENIKMLLETVKYDAGEVYWQECPMAFNDTEAANWLSKTEKIMNPYLGNKDPRYGKTMLHCGESKMKIDFRPKDSTKAE